MVRRAVPLLVVPEIARLVWLTLAVAPLLFDTRWDSWWPLLLAYAAMPVAALGQLELARRTHGAARVLAWISAATLPLYVVAAVATSELAELAPAQLAVAWPAFEGLSAAQAVTGIAAMWLAAERRLAFVAVCAVPGLLGVTEAPIPGLARALEAVANIHVALAFAVLGSGPLLALVLAVRAGRHAEPLALDPARAGRALGRAWIAIAVLAVPAIYLSIGGETLAIPFAFRTIGVALASVAVYRARAIAPWAFASAIGALFVAGFVGFDRDTTFMMRQLTPQYPVIAIALAAIVLGAAHRTRSRVCAVLGGSCAVLAPLAFAGLGAHVTAVVSFASLAIGGAGVIAAGRAVARLRVPASPQVADVFT